MSKKRTITVIGGGIAGYPAAIRAARLGAAVTLIEKADMGGTCLNRGCIPTKSLLQSVEVARVIKESETFGIKTGPAEIDFPAIANRKNEIVGFFRTTVASLVRRKKIKLIEGEAEVIDPKTVKIKGTNEKIVSDAMIVTTGSVPATLPIPGLDKADPWDSNDFLDMKKLPESSVIIGGGVIGVEIAQILAGFGRKVTILEMMPGLVPGLDLEISMALEQELSNQGVEIVTSAKVSNVAGTKTKRTVTYVSDGKNQTVDVERVIVAVGRIPLLKGLNHGKLGLAIEKGAVVVNDRMETNIKGIYAAGDVTGGIMLAHVATAEGECAAQNAMGNQRSVNYKAVPSCIYTIPQVASVGLSEEQAKKKYDVEVGRFPFSGCGKAVVIGETFGMVKIVADKKYGEVLGVHIIGPHATDLISEAVLAMSLESTVEEIAHAIHPHPTLSEAMMEAAQTLKGGAVHMP